MSFGATLVWFIALHVATLKMVSTTFAMVPGGRDFKLSTSGDVKSFQLQKPEFTIEFLKNQVDGIVADLHHERRVQISDAIHHESRRALGLRIERLEVTDHRKRY